MKTLLLMRHAKSSWDDSSLTDYERPLNERGKRDAPRMGRWLASQGFRPDRIVTSSARRARKTARRVAEALGYTEIIEERRDLYMASPHAWLTMLHAIPDTAACILGVGHNPTMELLVEQLGGTRHAMPTAAVACFTIQEETWLACHCGPHLSLQAVWTPDDLDD